MTRVYAFNVGETGAAGEASVQTSTTTTTSASVCTPQTSFCCCVCLLAASRVFEREVRTFRLHSPDRKFNAACMAHVDRRHCRTSSAAPDIKCETTHRPAETKKRILVLALRCGFNEREYCAHNTNTDQPKPRACTTCNMCLLSGPCPCVYSSATANT